MTSSTKVRRFERVIEYVPVTAQVVQGPDEGKSKLLRDRPLLVGSGDQCGFRLSDDTVSRNHCELSISERGIRVRDLESTNGTSVGDVRVLDAIIPANTTVQLGQTSIVFVPIDETLRLPLSQADHYYDLVGSSSRMRALYAELERLAGTDVSVLIEGETGTGKELVADSIHRASNRASGPFVVFDCGAAAASLIESELFGHERGSFTGASHAHSGVFEQANGGTLFLDELGELPMDLQPKLLRALEKREVRRLGSQNTRSVDVRLVSATNRNLADEVTRGSFRADLFYRVSATHVIVPPLRDRIEDLAPLLSHFFRRHQHSVSEVPAHIFELFRAYRWPGNVRELQNAAQRLVLTPDRAVPSNALALEAPSMPSGSRSKQALQPLRVARREASDVFERDYISRAMEASGGSVTRAASLAEVSRQMMQKLIKKHE